MKLRQDTTYQKGSIVRHSKIAPPMTAMGHQRPRRSKLNDKGCPLCPESGQTDRRLGMSALCHKRL
jgi:hypothetical protein